MLGALVWPFDMKDGIPETFRFSCRGDTREPRSQNRFEARLERSDGTVARRMGALRQSRVRLRATTGSMRFKLRCLRHGCPIWPRVWRGGGENLGPEFQEHARLDRRRTQRARPPRPRRAHLHDGDGLRH